MLTFTFSFSHLADTFVWLRNEEKEGERGEIIIVIIIFYDVLLKHYCEDYSSNLKTITIFTISLYDKDTLNKSLLILVLLIFRSLKL